MGGLNSIFKEATGAIPLVGPIVSLIEGFLKIGGGCGQACIAAAEGEQVVEAAGDDILHVVQARMLPGKDGAAMLQSLQEQGLQFLGNLAQQGDPHANDAIRNVQSIFASLISTAQGYGDANVTLDILTAQKLFIDPNTRGWYPASVISGNQLATQMLQTYLSNGAAAAENESLSGTLDAVLSNLNQQLAVAQQHSGGALSDILAGIAGISGAASSGSTDVIGKVLGAILGTVGVSQSTVQTIETDINKTLTGIATTIKTIQTDVIDKVVNPVIKSITDTENLQSSIEASLKNGLTGILQIPGELANYLTSQAKVSQQTAILNNEGRQQTASQILVPGMSDHIASPLRESTETFKQIFNQDAVGLDEFPKASLTEPKDLNDATGLIQKLLTDHNATLKSFGHFGQTIFNVLLLVDKGIALIENELKVASQAANILDPVEPLEPGDIIDAYFRDLLTIEQVKFEMQRQGISGDRAQLLIDAHYRLLNAGENLTGLRRGIISKADFDREMTNLNYTPERTQALIEITQYLQDPITAFDWFMRGGFNEPAFRNILKAQAWTDDDIDLAERYLQRVPPLSQYVTLKGRMAAAEKGFLADSLTSKPPNDVNEVNKDNRGEERNAGLAWLAHWRDVDPFIWLNAYYRSLINKDFFAESMESQNFPAEVTDVYIEANRPLISFFYVVEMFAAGVFSEEEGRSYLARYGFDSASIDAIIRFGNYKSLGKATAGNSALAQLSVSNLNTMYTDGVINTGQLLTGYEAHGYDAETANLLVSLEVTKKQLADRKSYATGQVNEVKAGLISQQQALDNLGARGYTQDEIAGYIQQIRAAKVANMKLPSEAQLKDMLLNGIISTETWKSAMSLLGFSEEWITPLLQLIEVKNG